MVSQLIPYIQYSSTLSHMLTESDNFFWLMKKWITFYWHWKIHPQDVLYNVAGLRRMNSFNIQIKTFSWLMIWNGRCKLIKIHYIQYVCYLFSHRKFSACLPYIKSALFVFIYSYRLRAVKLTEENRGCHILFYNKLDVTTEEIVLLTSNFFYGNTS